MGVNFGRLAAGTRIRGDGTKGEIKHTWRLVVLCQFLADNYAPFYSLPIECTDRDAAFVLDGLLYNESELEIEEHYTDTHGYTEINFAAFAMLGLRFCPRIRGVQHQRIYRIDPNRDYGSLASLIRRADQTIATEQIAEHSDLLGQLY